MQIRKRNGEVVGFDAQNIQQALLRAFIAQLGNVEGIAARAQAVTDSVCKQLTDNYASDAVVDIEQVQNYCEEQLMDHKELMVAKAFILYRQARSVERGTITLSNGTRISRKDLIDRSVRACATLSNVDPVLIVDRVFNDLFDGASPEQVRAALLLAVRPLIEQAPEYSSVAANLLLDQLYQEVLGIGEATPTQVANGYQSYFRTMIEAGVAADIYNPLLATTFDLDFLSANLHPERDHLHDYLGLQTLYDRYLVHIGGKRIEMPQSMFMRIAMGAALRECNPTQSALDFYNLLSTHDYMASTPTLFNAGLVHSQLSSCYLTTVPDDLAGIYASIRDNGLLSKFAGGIGNDWTPVRALGAFIKGTNGKSQGIVPFLKVANDTAIAVNQGGKRKGAVCAYLESWHMDMSEFLELRKNTGDDRRRTHDMNTANWIPDLLMERIEQDADWTLFTPDQVPDLHDLYGNEFREAYLRREQQAREGLIKSTTIKAKSLWRDMLSMLFETGHPWLTFKDACNLRSPQRHAGVVHSSNLCTEITLNTRASTYDQYGDRVTVGEVAVCNLGSINLPNHVDANGVVDEPKLARTVKLAVRMLDNVIDNNFYPVPEAKNANMQHRPVGLGFMGFQDVLYAMRISYADPRAVQVAADMQELIAYYAINASADLAQERGAYPSFAGSDWSQGVLPQDTAQRLADSRGIYGTEVVTSFPSSHNLDWEAVRTKVKRGMRNSNVMAIAPTATIANIVGVVPGNEPSFKNLYVKSNLSGEFTVINHWLVRDLRALGLWDQQMIADLKREDGSVSNLSRVPVELRELYKTAFDIEPVQLIDAAVARGLYIDQGQSLNLYMRGVSGKKLDTTYRYGHRKGLKTTYYLRTSEASSAEKSTGQGGELNKVSNGMNPVMPEAEGAACYLRPGDAGFEECEACQ